MAANCKQKYRTCNKCFGRHLLESECNPAVNICTNCKEQHPPTDRNCPAREKALNLKRVMVLENLSIREARAKYAGVIAGNRFELLGEEGLGDSFPALKTRPDRVIDNSREAARFLHNSHSYAKAVRVNVNRQREEENARKGMAQWRALVNEEVQNQSNTGERVNRHTVSEVEKLATQLKNMTNSFFGRWGDKELSSNERLFIGEIGRAIDIESSGDGGRQLVRDEIFAI